MSCIKRDTTDGLRFEEEVVISEEGIDVSKRKLYRYIEEQGKYWRDAISRKLEPDKAFITPDKLLKVYEIKFQQTDGSVDEKITTCAFKLKEFKRIARLLELKDATYTYILSDWFRQPKYKDALDFIKESGCDYYFESDRKLAVLNDQFFV